MGTKLLIIAGILITILFCLLAVILGGDPQSNRWTYILQSNLYSEWHRDVKLYGERSDFDTHLGAYIWIHNRFPPPEHFTGLWNHWDDNGDLAWSGTFDNGVLDGPLTVYDPISGRDTVATVEYDAGTPAKGWVLSNVFSQNFKSSSWDPNHKVPKDPPLLVKLIIEQGEIARVTRPDGTPLEGIWAIARYSHGIGDLVFHEFHDGIAQGDQIQHHSNGQVESQLTQEEDGSSVERQFDEEGRLARIQTVKDDTVIFTQDWNTSDGALAQIASYDETTQSMTIIYDKIAAIDRRDQFGIPKD